MRVDHLERALGLFDLARRKVQEMVPWWGTEVERIGKGGDERLGKG
jgi:hypothetical protein